jgi:hypothetical protein
MRSNASLIASTRSESAIASPCDFLAGGEATTSGVRSVWTFGGDHFITLDQRLERTDAFGIHRDRFLSAVPCE